MFVFENKLICAREREKKKLRSRKRKSSKSVRIKMLFSKQVKMCNRERAREIKTQGGVEGILTLSLFQRKCNNVYIYSNSIRKIIMF